MYQGEVQPVPQTCTTCGGGPFNPRIDRNRDALGKQTIVEARWICGRCGSHFGHGIVEVIPDEPAKTK